MYTCFCKTQLLSPGPPLFQVDYRKHSRYTTCTSVGYIKILFLWILIKMESSGRVFLSQA
jgi:hypothetical protein